MPLVKVTPKADRVIRHEISGIRLSNDEPTEVEFSIYWHRLAERGDVSIEVPEEPTAKAAKTSKRESAKLEE